MKTKHAVPYFVTQNEYQEYFERRLADERNKVIEEVSKYTTFQTTVDEKGVAWIRADYLISKLNQLKGE